LQDGTYLTHRLLQSGAFWHRTRSGIQTR
jgi:hypothetical protein